MAVTLHMDKNYPDVSSGIVSFENVRTGTKVSIKAPEDLESGAYGIKSITIDTGAACTILPEDFAARLDVERPAARDKKYYIFGGVGGTNICFYSPVPIVIGVEDGKERMEEIISPFFLIGYAPSITSEGRMLSRPECQPHNNEIIPFISPPFRYCSRYTVEVHSPREKFQSRRLQLEVDVGQEMDYILIGRDWQEGFDILFKAEEMVITEQTLGRL